MLGTTISSYPIGGYSVDDCRDLPTNEPYLAAPTRSRSMRRVGIRRVLGALLFGERFTNHT